MAKSVDLVKLQHVVNKACQEGRPARTLEDLCYKVAQMNWSQFMGLDALTIRQAIEKNKLTFTLAKPEPAPEPVKVAPVAPVVQAAPVVQPVAKAEVVAPKPQETVKVHTEAGRGKKTCPKCAAIVGNRTGTCICGHEFSVNGKGFVQPKVNEPVKEVAEKPAVQEAPKKTREQIFEVMILTPSGKPPVKLEGTDLQAVQTWAEENRYEVSNKLNGFLSLTALMYWARHGKRPKEEVKIIQEHLRSLYAHESHETIANTP